MSHITNKQAKYTPVVVGVGDVINRSLEVQDAIEPLNLMVSAIKAAIKDTGCTNAPSLQSAIDSIDVVKTWTWPYHDLPGLIGKELGVRPGHKFTSPHGGDQPAKLFDSAARRIALGEAQFAVVTGGEALASLGACAAKGTLPPPGWTETDTSVEAVFSPTTVDLGGDLGGIHSIGAPIQVYPLYENAFRAKQGQSMDENTKASSELYAEFARIASQNPTSWTYGKEPATEQTIGTVTKKNRMICFPYPLLMNAFNNVNIAGACIMTSTDLALKYGIPQSKWIYPLGGAGTRDSYAFWERPNFFSSPSISKSLDTALSVSNLTCNQVDLFDLYSCFPIVPKLACRHLEIPLTGGDRPLTLLGGLTSFGGAGNNYSMHAIVEMVKQLRRGNGTNGLILANGGTLTYQYVLCLSSKPRSDDSPYPTRNMLPENLEDESHPKIERNANGEVSVETYTVEFNRDGSPSMGYVVGRLSNGHRVLANDADEETLAELASSSEEQVGKRGWATPDPDTEDRTIFTFHKPSSKL